VEELVIEGEITEIRTAGLVNKEAAADLLVHGTIEGPPGVSPDHGSRDYLLLGTPAGPSPLHVQKLSRNPNTFAKAVKKTFAKRQPSVVTRKSLDRFDVSFWTAEHS
jgi:hypothetical protein